MKNIKNLVKGCWLVGVASAICVVNIFSMRMTPQQVERGKAATKQVMVRMEEQKHQLEERKNQYFIHEINNSENGIWVDKQFVKDNCKTIKNMVEDFGEELNTISLSFSVEIIKLGFDLLRDKKDVKYLSDVKNLSFEEWVDVANLFNFLDVPADKMQAVLAKIKTEIIDKNSAIIVTVLKNLHPDLQKVLFADASDYLKNCIAQKYTKNRGKPLTGQPERLTTAVAISPDGTKIVAGNAKEIILWDISDPSSIKRYPSTSVPFDVNLVAFSPDGKHVISSSRVFAPVSDLVLWNISDLNNITPRRLGAVQDNVQLVAFSPDGKKVFLSGNDFTVWDISNPDNITAREFLTDLGEPKALSSDGRLVALVGDNTFMIKDVSGAKVIEYKPVEKINVGKIDKLAFSSDGKAVISYGDQLILWDVSDLSNIKNHKLVGILDFAKDILGYLPDIVILSHDGKKIVLSSGDKFVLLDIHNPNNRVVIDKISRSILSMKLSPDDKHIVTVGTMTSFGTNFYLWTLLTDQEEALLNQIKNYNADQVRLIYQLCLQSSKKQTIELKKGSEEEQIFNTLPEDMQKLLIDLFLPKGWFSGWWK